MIYNIYLAFLMLAISLLVLRVEGDCLVKAEFTMGNETIGASGYQCIKREPSKWVWE